MRKFVRAFKALLTSSALLLNFGMQSSLAGEAEFYAQCHKFLPIADDFASDCLQKARSFQRTFYPSGGSRGEVESFSAYFKPLDTPSRFLLGCVLNFKHQLSFVGVYYSHEKIDMQQFDQYPIAFIDFNANIGVEVGGRQLTLFAIRQFVTGVIPEHVHGVQKNCEPENIEYIDDRSPIYNGYGTRYKIMDNLIRPIASDGETDPEIKVIMYFLPHKTQLVYATILNWAFIDADGALMLNAQTEHNICSRQIHDNTSEYNILYEMCQDHSHPSP